MKIAVLDDYQNSFKYLNCCSRLKGHDVTCFRDTVSNPVELASQLDGYDAAVLTQQRTALPHAVVALLTTLRFISQTGHNTSHLDIDALSNRGILISAGGGGGPAATAELCWALILAAQRNIPNEVKQLREGHWQSSVGIGLSGKILGIYAYGRIGSAVARVGKAFGMEVVCWGRAGSTAKARADGYEVAASRKQFFASSDVLSLHIALKPETHGIITSDDLASMKSTALLVNTSRAPLIAPGMLVEALRQGRPGRAAVDVYEQEPVLLGDHPLLHLPNALCTPHLGYVEQGAYEKIFGVAIDQILAYAAGTPINTTQSSRSASSAMNGRHLKHDLCVFELIFH